MKCMAARSEELSEDRGDVQFLVRSLGLTTAEEVFGVVGRFYPIDRLHARTRYFVGEVIAGLDDAPENRSGLKV